MACTTNIKLTKVGYNDSIKSVTATPGGSQTVQFPMTKVSVTGKNVIIFVLSNIYSQAKSAIDTWASDISKDLNCNTKILTDATWSDQWAIRNTLKQYYDSNALLGSIIVGDIPRMSCHVVQEVYDPSKEGSLQPLEYFYMDFEYDFTKQSTLFPGNPLYIYKMKPFRTKICQAFCARIIPPGGDINYINTYLAKNHAYRTGQQANYSGVGYFDSFSWSYVVLMYNKYYNGCIPQCPKDDFECRHRCVALHWTRDEYLNYYSNLASYIGLPNDTTHVALDFNTKTQQQTMLNLFSNKYKVIYTFTHGSNTSYASEPCKSPYGYGNTIFPLCEVINTDWIRVTSTDIINAGGIKSVVMMSYACSQGRCREDSHLISGNCIGNKLLFYGNLLAFPNSSADEVFGMGPYSLEDYVRYSVSDGKNCIGTVLINNKHYDSNASGNDVFWGDPTIIIK